MHALNDGMPWLAGTSEHRLFESVSLLPSATNWRSRAQAKVTCQVEGCQADLSLEEKIYCMKKRICSEHMRAECIRREGCGEHFWRFCFQCGKLEPLSLFDGARRSCRARLLRRRLPPMRSSSCPTGLGLGNSTTSTTFVADEPLLLRQDSPTSLSLPPATAPAAAELDADMQHLLALQRQKVLVEQRMQQLKEQLALKYSPAPVPAGLGTSSPAVSHADMELPAASYALPRQQSGLQFPTASQPHNGMFPEQLQAAAMPCPTGLFLHSGGLVLPACNTTPQAAASSTPAAAAAVTAEPSVGLLNHEGSAAGGASLSGVRSEDDSQLSALDLDIERIMADELHAALSPSPHDVSLPARPPQQPQQLLHALSVGTPAATSGGIPAGPLPLAAGAPTTTAQGLISTSQVVRGSQMLHEQGSVPAAASRMVPTGSTPHHTDGEEAAATVAARKEYLEQRSLWLQELFNTVSEMYQDMRDIALADRL